MDTTLGTGRCSLWKCIQGDLDLTMARVEVKSFVVKADEREHMEVSVELVCLFLCLFKSVLNIGKNISDGVVYYSLSDVPVSDLGLSGCLKKVHCYLRKKKHPVGPHQILISSCTSLA